MLHPYCSDNMPNSNLQKTHLTTSLALARHLFCAGFFGVLPSIAQSQTSRPPTPEGVAIEQQRRAAERENAQRAAQEKTPDVRLTPELQKQTALLPANEQPCFLIQTVVIESTGQALPTGVLDALHKAASLQGMDTPLQRCLGQQGVQILIDRLQHELIAQGFSTSSVMAAPQNLQTGQLILKVFTGRVGRISVKPSTSGDVHNVAVWNAVPIQAGDVLNLRAIEQALENFKRVPTAEADIKIVPASEEGYSDLVVEYSQKFPVRLGLSADDSGSTATGKYQGQATLNIDSPFSHSDLFYITLSHELGGKDPGPRGTKGYTAHYSIPFGYWALALTKSNNQYRQTVAGLNQDYVYSGINDNAEIKLSRVVWRNAAGKTTLSLKGFQRVSSNAIDDTEVEVQRRQVGGWELGISHKHAWGEVKAEGQLSYKQGTGAFGAFATPEELFGEGTSRMKLILVDVNFTAPIQLGEQSWTYNGVWRGQLNQTILSPQDRFSVGGRFTVRGFDGQSVLTGEKGWLIRNEMSTPLGGSKQKIYIALDHGRVGGPSAAQGIARQLTGMALGLRGEVGPVQWDAFVARPVQAPDRFKTQQQQAGFSLQAQF